MSKLNSSHGFISLLYSISDNPLGLWSKHVSTDGRVRRVEDDTLNGDRVIEIKGPENSPISTNISCPASPEDFLKIQLPVLAIVLKYLKARVQIAFQLIDEESIRRKFILSTCDNGKKTGVVEPETARLPLELDEGWNLLEINLRTLCQTTYHTEYRALQRLIIYPNCRVRRIYLQDRHYEHNETPVELCQAFFDMYMLKWGIHFVEKSCQTNETFKEVKSDEKLSVSLPKKPLLLTKPKNPKSLSSDKSTSKHLRPSPGKRVLTKKKINSSDDNVVINDDKKTKISKPETRKRKKSNDKVEEETSLSAIAASTPIKIEKNLKTDEREGEIFRKWPYYVPTLQQNDQSESDKLKFINSANMPAKDPIIVGSVSSTFPERKWTGTRLLNALLTPVATIPSEVEAEATEASKNVESTKSKLLTTDEAVGNFLELRHVVNRKMLENFRVRGLTMTEVELSIYNSKHRRNSYGQGKLVEKHRVSVDKACNVVPDNNTYEKKRKKSAARQ